MSKRKPLGQDPLAWIKKTSEEELAASVAETAETPTPPASEEEGGVEPTEAAAPEPMPEAALVPGPTPQATRPRLPLLLIVTLDFLLLIILGFLGYMLLSKRIDKLSSRVGKLEAAHSVTGRTPQAPLKSERGSR